MRHDDPAGLNRPLQERDMLAMTHFHLLYDDAVDLAEVVLSGPAGFLDQLVAALEVSPEGGRG